MDVLISILSIALAIYAVIRICSKAQSTKTKFLKSICALWYFLYAGGIIVSSDYEEIGVVLLIVGTVVLFYPKNIMRLHLQSFAQIIIKPKARAMITPRM